MPFANEGAGAATLGDGRVLVVGGAASSSAELYDPLANGWSAAAPMPVKRNFPAAASLPGDRVLVVGGADTDQPSASIYDGRADRWSPAPAMPDDGGFELTAAPLPGGRVLVVGGGDGTNAAIYNSTTNTWSWAPNIDGPSWGGEVGSAAPLSDGRVLVTSADAQQASQVYDSTTNTWSYTSPGPYYVTNANGVPTFTDDSPGGPAAPLTDGHALVLGTAGDPAVAKIYNENDNGWTQATQQPDYRLSEAVAPLDDGRVLVVGGSADSKALASTEVFTPPPSYPPSQGANNAQIDGDPIVGNVLAATGGTGAFQYQWQRCRTTCVNIGPQSASTTRPSLYDVTSSDVGATLQVVVSSDVSNTSNPTTAVSWPTGGFETGNDTRWLRPSAIPTGIDLRRSRSREPASVRFTISPDPRLGQTDSAFIGTLDFAPGQQEAEIGMPTGDHGVPLLERHYTLTLSSPVGFVLQPPTQLQINLCPGGPGNPLLACGDTPRDPADPLGLVPAPTTSNPLVGSQFFIDSTGTAADKAQASLWASNPAQAAMLSQIVDEPGVTRFGKWDGPYPGQSVQSFLNRATRRDPGAIPMLATYKIVDHHCGGWADPPADQTAYHTWITNLAEGIGNTPAVLFLEMDSLITVGCLSPQGVTVRMNEIHDAINVLSHDPHLVIYLDAGAADAAPAAKMARLLERAGVAQIQGFFLNSTHFDWTKKEIKYGEQISKLTGGKHFVINTAENGQGPLIPKNRAKHGNEVLCDPLNRGLGPLPTANTGYRSVDAFAWIANPGVSGNHCRPGAPAGGVFWVKLALELVKHADFKVR
jgi:endoglucanase